MRKLALVLLISAATAALAGIPRDAQPAATHATANEELTNLPTYTLYIASELPEPGQSAGLPGAISLDSLSTWTGTRVHDPVVLAFVVIGLQALIRRR